MVLMNLEYLKKIETLKHKGVFGAPKIPRIFERLVEKNPPKKTKFIL